MADQKNQAGPPSLFIDDGYCDKGSVPAFGRRPAFDIYFRPTMIEPRLRYEGAAGRSTLQAELAATITYEQIDKIVIRDPAKPEAEWLASKPPLDIWKRLPGYQMQACINFVLGYIPPTLEDKEKN